MMAPQITSIGFPARCCRVVTLDEQGGTRRLTRSGLCPLIDRSRWPQESGPTETEARLVPVTNDRRTQRGATSDATNAPSKRPPAWSRIVAIGALTVFGATMVVLIIFTARNLLYVAAALLASGMSISALWIAATNKRFRWLATAVAVLSLVGTVVSLTEVGRGLVAVALALVGILAASMLGTLALHWEVDDALTERWHPVAAARHGVLLMNPVSGDAKVARFHLFEEAQRRGILPVLLQPGDDLEELAETAVSQGADVLGMAGGDGSQAVVAAVAARHRVPFVCVPAGTRNHFALDLGIDRNDPVRALNAYGPAHEAIVDLAEVNGAVFVNNVSLGFYAELVSSDQYRRAKRRTVTKMLPEFLGPGAPPSGLLLDGPEGPIVDAQVVEVSNNPYTLCSVIGFGSRSWLDTGTLGVASLTIRRPSDVNRLVALEMAGHPERFDGWHQWSAGQLEVRGPHQLLAAIDGEARTLKPPLAFAIWPHSLRVRIAAGQVGASPALRQGPVGVSTLAGLSRVARGRPSGIVVRPGKAAE